MKTPSAIMQLQQLAATLQQAGSASSASGRPPQQALQALANAVLSILPGQRMQLSIDGRPPITVQPSAQHVPQQAEKITPQTDKVLTNGPKRLAKTSTREAVLFEIVNQALTRPANLSADALVRSLAASAKHNLPALLTLPVTILRNNNGNLQLAHPGWERPVSVQQVGQPVAGRTELTVGFHSGEPVFQLNKQPVSIAPAQQQAVVHSAIQALLEQKGVIVQAPLPGLAQHPALQTSHNMPLHVALQTKAGQPQVVVHQHDLSPRARLNLPAALMSQLPAIPASPAHQRLPLLESVLTPSAPASAEPRSTLSQIPQLAARLLAQTGSTHQALQALVQLFEGADTPAQSAAGSVQRAERAVVSATPRAATPTSVTDNSGVRANNSSAQAEAAATNKMSTNVLEQSGEVERAAILQQLRQATDTSTASGEANRPAPVSAEQIKQIMAQATMPLTFTRVMTPARPDNLLSALFSLLQQARSGTSASPIEHSPATAGQAPRSSAQASPRESSANERQRALLGPLRTLLANHQLSALGNLEARSQGAEQLQFVVPVSHAAQPCPEVRIEKREEAAEQSRKAGQRPGQWALTMKLSAGVLGDMMVKARISADTVSLNLYAETPALLARVHDTLPLLTRRLTALGVHVDEAQALQGKIPAQLNQQKYQLFEVRV